MSEYLALEHDLRRRHEYPDGTIYAMVGELRAHVALRDNVVDALDTPRPRLSGSRFRGPG
jgi:hypothetical protein